MEMRLSLLHFANITCKLILFGLCPGEAVSGNAMTTDLADTIH